MRRIFALLALLPPALAASACEQPSTPPDSSPPKGTDAGSPRARTLAYVPSGCGYEVRTPELDEAGMSEEIFGAPAPTFDQIHVSWAGPTHSSFAVNWRSDEGTLASRVLYGTDRGAVAAADGPTDGVHEQVGHHMLYSSTLGGRGSTRIHEVHVCGLDSSTTYHYKVGGSGHWSDVFATATGPELGTTEPFSFAVTGDSRNNIENAWPISQRRLMEQGVDFEIFSGDAVFLGPNQQDWREFFGATDGDFAVQELLASVPLMMVNGNHEQLAINYVTQFAFPQEESAGEQAEGEEWYAFDYGNAHFLMLNDTVTEASVIAGAQADWIRADLSRVDRTRTPWVFAVHHRGFYTCGSTHSPDAALRAAWQPLFDEFAVDFVLTGHNHVYERSRAIRGLNEGEGVVVATEADGLPTHDSAGLPDGTVYVVAAGVGAELYDVSTECPTSHTAQVVRPYVIFEIEDRTLRYTAYDAMTNQIIDSFELTK